MTVYAVAENEYGIASADVEWCEQPLPGQPGMRCTRRAEHSGEHEAMAAWPPCMSCWGLDEHLSGCLMPHMTTRRSVVVQWASDDTNEDGDGE